MPAFTSVATRVYKDPVTSQYLNSLKANDDYFFTGTVGTWVQFGGTAVTANAHNNISSIGDNGVGLYTINFVSGFSNSNYVAMGISKFLADQSIMSLVTAIGVTSCQVRVSNMIGTVHDSENIGIGFVGLKP